MKNGPIRPSGHYTNTRNVLAIGWRYSAFLRALSEAGLQAILSLNADAAESIRPLDRGDFDWAGHETLQHTGVDGASHHYGLSESEGERVDRAVRATLPDSKSWMSPARNEAISARGFVG